MATTNRKNANKQKIILSAIIALIIIISGIISERFFDIPSAETDNTVIDSSFSVQFILILSQQHIIPEYKSSLRNRL